MRDPYEVLGVPRGANAAAIKSAYRKLAKKHHPDNNKNDPKAAERFAELNTANEILGDEDTDDVVERLLIDRIARVPLGAHQRPYLALARFRIHGDDLGARPHHVARPFRVEIEDAREHRAIRLVERAMGARLHDE